MTDWPARQRNTIRYTFLHPAARGLWPDWERKARGCVAHLRAVAGGDPDAPDLATLVGELIVKSPDFSRLWDRYEVRRAGADEKVFRHPGVGTVTVTQEVLDLSGPGGSVSSCTWPRLAAPSHDALMLLDLAGDIPGGGPGPDHPASARA